MDGILKKNPGGNEAGLSDFLRERQVEDSYRPAVLHPDVRDSDTSGAPDDAVTSRRAFGFTPDTGTWTMERSRTGFVHAAPNKHTLLLLETFQKIFSVLPCLSFPVSFQPSEMSHFCSQSAFNLLTAHSNPSWSFNFRSSKTDFSTLQCTVDSSPSPSISAPAQVVSSRVSLKHCGWASFSLRSVFIPNLIL